MGKWPATIIVPESKLTQDKKKIDNAIKGIEDEKKKAEKQKQLTEESLTYELQKDVFKNWYGEIRIYKIKAADAKDYIIPQSKGFFGSFWCWVIFVIALAAAIVLATKKRKPTL